MNLARYRFVLSRPLQLLPVLFGISLITFVLVRSIQIGRASCRERV